MLVIFVRRDHFFQRWCYNSIILPEFTIITVYFEHQMTLYSFMPVFVFQSTAAPNFWSRFPMKATTWNFLYVLVSFSLFYTHYSYGFSFIVLFAFPIVQVGSQLSSLQWEYCKKDLQDLDFVTFKHGSHPCRKEI